MEIKKDFTCISKCYFDIQTIFNCCEVAFLKFIKENSVCQLENLILNIIKELFCPNNISMKKYITNFKFKLSTEEIIIYAILSFYDLDDISNAKFIFNSCTSTIVAAYSTSKFSLYFISIGIFIL